MQMVLGWGGESGKGMITGCCSSYLILHSQKKTSLYSAGSAWIATSNSYEESCLEIVSWLLLRFCEQQH